MLISYKGHGCGEHYFVLRCPDCDGMIEEYGSKKFGMCKCKKCNKVFSFKQLGIIMEE